MLVDDVSPSTCTHVRRAMKSGSGARRSRRPPLSSAWLLAGRGLEWEASTLRTGFETGRNPLKKAPPPALARVPFSQSSGVLPRACAATSPLALLVRTTELLSLFPLPLPSALSSTLHTLVWAHSEAFPSSTISSICFAVLVV